jgi:hypothetical protein
MNDLEKKENKKPHDPPGHNREYKIIVNAREHTWKEKKISFDQVILLAFGSISDDPNVIYTVTFKKGQGNNEGSMVKGDSEKVKDGMIFNATQTNKS